MFLLGAFFCNSQNIKKLEHDLRSYSRAEDETAKIEEAKYLQSIDTFNFIAVEYICRHYKDRNIDSVSIFFDNLIKEYPNHVEPHLLRSELFFLENNKGIKDKIEIKHLNAALKVDENHPVVIFKLAEFYYRDFIYPLEKEQDWNIVFEIPENTFEEDSAFLKLILQETLEDTLDVDSAFIKLIEDETPVKQSFFEHPADSALLYFYKLWDLNEEKRDIIYYPIKQLECYLNKIDNNIISNIEEEYFEQCFFPSWYFANIDKGWQCDFTVNYLFELESSKRSAEWIRIQLTDLKEDCLYDRNVEPNTVIYRFTWLRSFEHPISIRIEKTKKKIWLYWKIGKGSGGYKPEGLKESGEKELTLRDWKIFRKKVRKSGFNNLPNENYTIMTDGASWVLEKKTSKGFKAHQTNDPYGDFKEACLFLLEKTGIRIKEENIY